jgi:hypothetical protein
LSLVVLAAAAVAEQRFGAVQELLLPLADLDRVDLEGPRQLGLGPGLLDGLQGKLRLEGGRMALLTCVGHDERRDATVTFDRFNIRSGPVLGVHFTGRRGGFPVASPDQQFKFDTPRGGFDPPIENPKTNFEPVGLSAGSATSLERASPFSDGLLESAPGD